MLYCFLSLTSLKKKNKCVCCRQLKHFDKNIKKQYGILITLSFYAILFVFVARLCFYIVYIVEFDDMPISSKKLKNDYTNNIQFQTYEIICKNH